MRKASYVSRVLLSTFGTKLILLWLITLLVSFGLSMSIGIARDQLDTQSYYLNDDMGDLAFFVDTTAAYYPMSRDAQVQCGNYRMSSHPGLVCRRSMHKPHWRMPAKGLSAMRTHPPYCAGCICQLPSMVSRSGLTGANVQFGWITVWPANIVRR